MNNTLDYHRGFGNHFESESKPHALVRHSNSPQKVPFGLYAEQLSGAAFTRPRHTNLHSWLYRIRPSVLHSEFTLATQPFLHSPPFPVEHTPPTQMRWDPRPYPSATCDFLESLLTLAGNGSIETHEGSAIHLYCATRSMENNFFYNADGDFLIVPQEGKLRFKTEFGWLEVTPGEIIVIPRGIKYQVELLEDKARGYICENYGLPFQLPELGILGANGLAHPRHFLSPVAAYEDCTGDFILYTKFQGRLWTSRLTHSPLDVVAWHGTYVPFKYDLRAFNTVNSVSYDHPDPSIFTVLSSPSALPGIANIDFVIFPPRWVVAEETFRPPYFHRNIMSEYMGLIEGTYDAKMNGFLPGGGSLHNCMAAHGPDAIAYQKAISSQLTPEFYAATLAFMFESRQVYRLTEAGYQANFRQKEYINCWQALTSNFKLN